MPRAKIIGTIKLCHLEIGIRTMDLVVVEDYKYSFRVCGGAEEHEVEFPNIFSYKDVAFMILQEIRTLGIKSGVLWYYLL